VPRLLHISVLVIAELALATLILALASGGVAFVLIATMIVALTALGLPLILVPLPRQRRERMPDTVAQKLFN
jgi:hypothetical protein